MTMTMINNRPITIGDNAEPAAAADVAVAVEIIPVDASEEQEQEADVEAEESNANANAAAAEPNPKPWKKVGLITTACGGLVLVAGVVSYVTSSSASSKEMSNIRSNQMKKQPKATEMGGPGLALEQVAAKASNSKSKASNSEFAFFGNAETALIYQL